MRFPYFDSTFSASFLPMALALLLFVFECLGGDRAVERDQLRDQRLKFRMSRQEMLRAARVLEHALEKLQVVGVELFTAIDFLLQFERAWQPNIIQLLQHRLDGAGILLRGFAHDFSPLLVFRYLSTAISRLCTMP